MDRAAWAIWTAIKKYGLSFYLLEHIYFSYQHTDVMKVVFRETFVRKFLMKLWAYFFIAAHIAQVAWPFEQHWPGSLDNLDSNKEIQPMYPIR